MSKFPQLQTNFTSGVLEPKLAAREDVVDYYNGLKAAKNLIVIPSGGATVRPALGYVREMMPVLSAVDVSGAGVTVAHGGTGNNVRDGDDTTYLTTTDDLSNINPFVVCVMDLGVLKNVAAVDIVNYKLSTGAVAGEFFVQTSVDNVTYATLGTAFDIDARDRSRRMRSASGAVSARYIKLVRIGSTNVAAKVSVAGIRVWEKAATLSEARLIPFAYSTEEAYMMVMSDRNIDVLKGMDYHGSIYVPHTSTELAAISFTQSLDTLLVFRRNIQPWKIFRQGGDDEFDYRYAVFENVPQYDYGAGTGGVNEVQVLNDGGSLAAGDDFTILLEGERTTNIAADASRATTASNIQTALRALANTSASGITVADAGGVGFTVTFGGADGLQPWSAMSVSVNTGSSSWSTSRTTKGRVPGEDIMSNARGWPRKGVFHQSRLHLGGIPGVPDAYLASAIDATYFNFDTERDDATKGLLVRAESDQVSAIYNIVAGRNLTFLTNDGEFYIPTEKIDEESVPKHTTDAGSKEGMPAFKVEGAIVFFQGVKDESDDTREIATSLQEFIFEDVQQAYKTNLLSRLSSHLLNNPVDAAFRKGLSTDEASLIVIVNEDGTGINYTILRGELVNAFMPMTLRAGDKLKAVGVDKKRRVYFVTERIIDGVARHYIEMWNKNLFLDCGVIVPITAEEQLAVSNAQNEFLWTFTNPGSAEAIGVRLNGGRLAPDEYSVNLGAKKVTLSPERAASIVIGDTVRIASMVKDVTGADHLEGETVQTFIDGTEGEDYLVAGGAFSLNDYADTEIQYGFDFEVSGELMPLRVPGQNSLVGEKVSICEVVVNVFETCGIEVKANDGQWQSFDLIKTDENILDRSTLELLATGEYKKDGLKGSEIGGPVEFRRAGIGPFTLLGITRKVRS